MVWGGFGHKKTSGDLFRWFSDEKRRFLRLEIWSGRAESNRRLILGKDPFYH